VQAVGDTAFSSAVSAFNAPTENPPMRPVNFEAPMIVVCLGAEAYPPSGTSGSPRGALPIRRE